MKGSGVFDRLCVCLCRQSGIFLLHCFGFWVMVSSEVGSLPDGTKHLYSMSRWHGCIESIVYGGGPIKMESISFFLDYDKMA